MKNIKYILGILILSAYSCADVDPTIPFSDFNTGAYLRTIKAPTTINFFDIPSYNFVLEVEAVDAQDGRTVQEVDVFVKRRRGATLSPEVKLATVPGSAFATNTTTKYLRATINIPIATALAAMGFTAADLAGGDFIEYRLAMLDTQGRVFTNSNLSPDIVGGSFYRSPFFYRVAVVCPSDLAGSYSYVTTNIQCANCPGSVPGPAGCGPSVTGNGTLTATTTPGRFAVSDATFGQYGCAWSDNPAAGVFFVDACLKVSTAGSDAYGLIYTFTLVANTGTALTIDWQNNYGDGGRSVLTRTDSKTWPAGLTN